MCSYVHILSLVRLYPCCYKTFLSEIALLRKRKIVKVKLRYVVWSLIQSCIRSVNVRVFIAFGRLCCALVIWGNLHRQSSDHVHLCVSHFDSWKRGGHPLRQLSDRLLLDVHSYLGMFIHTLTHESTHSQMNQHQNEVATQNMTAIGWGIIYSCVCVW